MGPQASIHVRQAVRTMLRAVYAPALMRAVRFNADSQRTTLACMAYARIEQSHTPRFVFRTSVTNDQLTALQGVLY